MRPDDLDLLCCPDCQGPLRVGESGGAAGSGDLEAGELRCDPCSAAWPVVRGVPRFVPRENYASCFGLQWTLHARTQLDSYTGLPLSERRFFEATRWPRRLEGETVLEVGSGAGRFTAQAALTGARVVTVDYSYAVDANRQSHGHLPDVLFVQADVYRLPVRAAAFHRVFCFGVVQSTPDPRGTVHALASRLRPGGSLAIDCYDRTLGHYYLNPKYWLRPVTSRMDPERLYRWVRRYVDAAWPLAACLRRIPVVGVPLNWKLLVADHSRLGLRGALLKEWAYLDTFDMLAPRHDFPQTPATLRRWLEDAGLEAVDVHYGHNGIEARARRPER